MSTKDVVFTFSFETYADAVERGMMRPPDQILSTLMRSERVSGLLVANPFRWAPSSVARSVFGSGPALPRAPRRALHTPIRLRRADPVDVAGVRAEYTKYSASLRTAASKLGLTDPVAITTNPLVAGFSPLEWTTGTMFFGRDDWLSSPARREYWPAFEAAYRSIAESGIAVTAVSQQILDRIAPTGPSAVIPNGVEPREWLTDKPAEPAWMTQITHPRAIYVGTLDSRLDVEGIADLATRQSDLQVVLMGPQPDPAYLGPLRHLRNVHIRPSGGRVELVAALRNSDMALLSHRRTPLTEAMSPLKIYEYLAAGLPVISIDLPPVRGIDPRVVVVDAVSDFADVSQSTLALGIASESVRHAFVENNSWAQRHETILDLSLGAR
jgi:teichuronic acid biosynthesis glycosyltransferase TuaH